ncbi:hypothetical protein MMC07_006591 [Pseudocyphellaria aurata]|nr:hypothetical protein [Pseudocyphellaria aurata]
MTTPSAKALSSSALKRPRSQDSQRSVNSSSAIETQRTEEAPDDTSIPAVLRQTKAEIHAKFGELEWQQKLRIAQGRNDPKSKWVQEMTPQVRVRNRYVNVQPWAKSRIHLKVPEGKSDYINASPISLRDPLSGVETTFIAAQGPKSSGLSHFWHMLWQETKDVAVIVMLTQTAEAGKEKCFQYFPLDTDAGTYQIDPIGGAGESGSVAFVEIVEDEISRTTIRKLRLTFGEESRTIWHLLFCGWPDFSVPENEDRIALLELLKLSVEKNNVPKTPRIIHCSAGVGRSGTFIALEYLLAQVESGAMAESKDDEDMIFDVVNRLREQRMTMVQSETQYQFLHQVVREQFIKWQAAAKLDVATEERSPKLRRLARGIRSAFDVGERGGAARDQGKAPIITP